MVTTDHNFCMTKHILPYNFNICYRIYPGLELQCLLKVKEDLS